MIDLLAQGADLLATDEGRLLGLTVIEWGMMLGFLSAFVASIARAVTNGKRATSEKERGDEKASMSQLVFEAIEEAAEESPEAIRLLKRRVFNKSTKMGIQIRLDEDVQRHTQRIKRNPITAELSPDGPTPDADPEREVTPDEA